MNAQEFTALYTKQSADEALTAFKNEAGFSLIRLYPQGTPYFKDGRRMFIKIAVLDRGLFYGVDMTKPTKRGEEVDYVITDGEEYKKRVTNFFSDSGSNEVVFDEQLKRFRHTETGKVLTLNEFIDILAKNHMSDRLFWKRIANRLASTVLKTLFWLVNKHYDTVQASVDKYHFSKGSKPTTEEPKNIEPFFKYFYISKNLIFALLLLSLLMAVLVAAFPAKLPLASVWYSLFGEFSLSNPLVVLLFFLALFSSEKLSVWLNESIKDFLMPEQNTFSERKDSFIEKLHNYQYHNKFNLKIHL